jgi:hypothetical protein
MWLEGNGDGASLELMRTIHNAAKQETVAAVHAIEIAH